MGFGARRVKTTNRTTVRTLCPQAHLKPRIALWMAFFIGFSSTSVSADSGSAYLRFPSLRTRVCEGHSREPAGLPPGAIQPRAFSASGPGSECWRRLQLQLEMALILEPPG